MSEQRDGALGATGYVVISRTMRAAARIVIVLLLARFYLKSDVATFAYAFVAASLIATLSDLGLTDFAVREISTASSPAAVAYSVLKLRAALVPIAIVTSFVTIVATSTTPPLVALAIAAYATALSVSDLLGAIHRGHNRYAFDALEASVPALALVAAAGCAMWGASSLTFHASLGIVAAVAVGLRVVVAARRAREGSSNTRVPVVMLLKKGRWFAARAFVTAALFEMAIILLQQLSSTSQIAEFAVAQRPVGLMSQSLAVIALVFLPTLSRTFSREPEKLGAIVAEVNLIYLMLIPAGFAACMLGGDLFLAMSGEAYEGGTDLVRALAIATLVYNGTLTTAPLLAAHHERIVVTSSIVGVLVLAGTGISLVPSHGAEGAAIATAVAMSACKVIHVIGYRAASLPLGGKRHIVALVAAIGFITLTTVAGAALIPLLVGGAVISAGLTARLLSRARLTA